MVVSVKSVRYFFVACLTILLVPSASSLLADTVVLVDGNRFENVRVVYQAGRVNVIRRDGGIQSFDAATVRTVLRLPVRWNSGMSEAEFVRRMEGRIDEVIARIQVEEQRRLDAHRGYILGAVGRAAVLPGWHKIDRGEVVYGATIAAGALTSLLYFATSQNRYAGAQANYDDLNNPVTTFSLLSNSAGPIDLYIPLNFIEFQKRRSALNQAAARVDLAAVIVGTLWIANLAEALTYALLADRPFSGALAFQRKNSPRFSWHLAQRPSPGYQFDVFFQGRF